MNASSQSFQRLFVAGHRGMVGKAICRRVESDDSIELLTADRQHCRVYEYERWRKRPWPRRLIEHCAALLRSQL